MKWQLILGFFLVTAVSFSAQAQLSCQYQLDLVDSFGDGWNNSTLTVNVNGTNTIYTLDNVNDDGFFRSFFINFTDGDMVTFTYAPGIFEGEVSYFFYDAEGILIFSDGVGAVNPTVGQVYSATLTCPTCPRVGPSTVSVDDVRAFRADISWGTSDPDGVYLIEYGVSGFTPGAGSTATATQNNIRLNGLAEHTDYEFYITTLCANGDTSLTIGPFSFMTFWANNTGISNISTPESSCGMSTTEDITVTLRNYGGNPQSLIPFQFSINGVLVPVGQPTDGFFTGVLGKDSTYTIAFDRTFDFSEPGEYEILSWTELPGDSDHSNDTTRVLIVSIPTITEYPYSNNFEDGKQGWRADPEGINSSWAFGTPNAPTLSSAASGENAWVTNLTGNYNDNELSYLLSPCLDFSGMSVDPNITFSLFFDSEACCDEGWLEMRLHPDSAWVKVGANGSGLNWYNDDLNQWWDGTGGFSGWVSAFHPLEGAAGFSNVNLRFVFSTDGSAVRKGMGVDNVVISAPSTNDLGAISAGHTSTAICGDPADQVTISIYNFGTATQSDFDVSYQINGGVIVTETVPVSLAINEQTTYTFVVPFNTSTPGSYEVVVWTDFPDDLIQNDTATFYFATAIDFPLVEDFESGAYPLGWVTEDAFNIVYGPGAHNNASSVIGDNIYSGDQNFEITTIAYGPIQIGDSLLFDYRYTIWSAGTTPLVLGAGDKLEVFISSNCGTDYDLVYTIDETNHISSAAFQTVRLSLDDYEGEAIRIRLKGTWGTSDYWLDFDNINLKRCPASLGLSANVSNATGATASDGRITVSTSMGQTPLTFQWESGANSGTSLTNLQPGDYTITVTDKGGCSEVIEATVDVTVATNEIASLIQSIRIAPNPTSGSTRLNVAFRETTDVRIILHNNVGQILSEIRDQNVLEGNYNLDLSEFSSGLYFARIVVGNQVHTEKIVKAN